MKLNFALVAIAAVAIFAINFVHAAPIPPAFEQDVKSVFVDADGNNVLQTRSWPGSASRELDLLRDLDKFDERSSAGPSYTAGTSAVPAGIRRVAKVYQMNPYHLKNFDSRKRAGWSDYKKLWEAHNKAAFDRGVPLPRPPEHIPPETANEYAKRLFDNYKASVEDLRRQRQTPAEEVSAHTPNPDLDLNLDLSL